MTPVRRLADVFPGLADELVTPLIASGDPLAAGVGELPFYGRCRCTTTCPLLLTAPPGSSEPGAPALERDGESVMLLSLDPSGTVVTAIEVLDGRLLAGQEPGFTT